MAKAQRVATQVGARYGGNTRRLLVVLLLACGTPVPSRSRDDRLNTPSPTNWLGAAERRMLAHLSRSDIQRTTRMLSDARFAGRAMGTPGGADAASYLASELVRRGYLAVGSGTMTHAVTATRAHAEVTSHINVGDAELSGGEHFTFSPQQRTATLEVKGEIVVVGYGVRSAKLGRDDLHGLDLRGKIVLLLRGRPAQAGALWETEATRASVLAGIAQGGVSAILMCGIDAGANTLSQLQREMAAGPWQLNDADLTGDRRPELLAITAAGAAISKSLQEFAGKSSKDIRTQREEKFLAIGRRF